MTLRAGRVFLASFVLLLCTTVLYASETIVPDSSLTPTTSLYTNNYGNIVLTTGGGNANGVGDPSGRNDDGFSGPINLGFTLSLYGTNYTSFFINNNGNVSFGSGIADYTPNGPTGANAPIISPFFADVDTRNPASGVVQFNQIMSGSTVVADVITWPSVGYFSEEANELDTFQLVLLNPSLPIPTGEGNIGFFWNTMQWEVGGASGGVNGFCPAGTAGVSCFPAAVGFGDGMGNEEVLQGSLQSGISGIVNDEELWFNSSGNGNPTPVGTVPEPGSVFLIGSG